MKQTALVLGIFGALLLIAGCAGPGLDDTNDTAGEPVANDTGTNDTAANATVDDTGNVTGNDTMGNATNATGNMTGNATGAAGNNTTAGNDTTGTAGNQTGGTIGGQELTGEGQVVVLITEQGNADDYENLELTVDSIMLRRSGSDTGTAGSAGIEDDSDITNDTTGQAVNTSVSYQEYDNVRPTTYSNTSRTANTTDDTTTGSAADDNDTTAVSGDWVTVPVESASVDLVQLGEDNANQVIADSEIPEGTYDMVRLMVSEASVSENDEDYDVVVPQGVLTLEDVEFRVMDGEVTAILMEVDAAESLFMTEDNDTMVFAPVMNVEIREGADVDTSNDQDADMTGGTVVMDEELGTDVEGYVGTGNSISSGQTLSVDGDTVTENN